MQKLFIYLFILVTPLGLASCQSAEAEKPATTTLANKNLNTPKKQNAKIITPQKVQPQKGVEIAGFPFDIDLKRADGSLTKSSEVLDNDGKPMVVLFWLTTCFPCKMEMASIQKVYKDWQEETGIELVAISTDFEKNYGKFSKMVKEKNWPWEAYNDVNREFRRVMPGGLNGLPQTFLLDKNGKIVYHKRKYRPGDEDVLYDKIKEVMGQG